MEFRSHPPSAGSLTRRTFLSGAAGIGAAALVAGCDSNDPGDGGGTEGPALDFTTTTGVLNYLYAFEQLQAAFYTQVLNTPYSGMPSADLLLFYELRAHEVIHRDVLKAVLGGSALAPVEIIFSSVNFNSRDSVLAAARTLEDLGVAAYNGVARYLTPGEAPVLVGKIASVESRHASVVRSVIAPETEAFARVDYSGPGIAAPLGASEANGLDGGASPQQVLAAARPYLVTSFTASNA